MLLIRKSYSKKSVNLLADNVIKWYNNNDTIIYNLTQSMIFVMNNHRYLGLVYVFSIKILTPDILYDRILKRLIGFFDTVWRPNKCIYILHAIKTIYSMQLFAKVVAFNAIRSRFQSKINIINKEADLFIQSLIILYEFHNFQNNFSCKLRADYLSVLKYSFKLKLENIIS